MLRFLFGGGKAEKAKVETQREAFARLLSELNELTGGLSEKPKITIDPNSGAIELDLPETLPDEALALPAPEPTKDETSEEAKSESPKSETSQTKPSETETSETEAKPSPAKAA